MRRRRDESGFTLIELLMSITLSMIVFAAIISALLVTLQTTVGLADSADVSTNEDDRVVVNQVEANLAVQTLTRRWSLDVQNTPRRSWVELPAPEAVRPCAAEPSVELPGLERGLLTLEQRDGAGGVVLVHFRYSRDTSLQHAQISRYECRGSSRSDASAAAPLAEVLAAGLSSTSFPTISQPTEATVRLAVPLVTQRTFNLEATMRIDLDSGPGIPDEDDGTPDDYAELGGLIMYDSDASGSGVDGFIQRVVATFSKDVDATCVPLTSWTPASSPSGATLLAAAPLDGRNVELTFAAPTEAADTAAADFRLSYSPPTLAACDLVRASSPEVPVDAAGPFLLSAVDTAGTTDGKVEPGDTLTLTFSEPLGADSVPSSTTVRESATPTNAPNFDTLTIQGLTAGALPIGLNNTYVEANPNNPRTASCAASVGLDENVITITVLGPTSSCDFYSRFRGGPPTPIQFIPAASLTDGATTANGAAPTARRVTLNRPPGTPPGTPPTKGIF